MNYFAIGILGFVLYPGESVKRSVAKVPVVLAASTSSERKDAAGCKQQSATFQFCFLGDLRKKAM